MAENSKAVSKEEELKKLSKVNMIRSLLPIIGLVAVFVIFNVLTKGGMWSARKLIMNQIYVVMIAATGVFFIMTMGGLDFSQGSIMGIASIAVCMLSKTNIFLALLGGIVAGACIGAVNGFFYVNRKIKSFIVTICTMFLFRGFIKYMASNSPVAASMAVYDYDTTAVKLGITLLVLGIGFFVFRFTKFGMYLKAIGAGEKAAKFAGIRTDRMKFMIYMLAGAITGLAAFVNIVKNGSATANVGNQLETQILIALVLGGPYHDGTYDPGHAAGAGHRVPDLRGSVRGQTESPGDQVNKSAEKESIRYEQAVFYSGQSGPLRQRMP